MSMSSELLEIVNAIINDDYTTFSTFVEDGSVLANLNAQDEEGKTLTMYASPC